MNTAVKNREAFCTTSKQIIYSTELWCWAMANGNSSFAIKLTELCSSAAIMSGDHDSGASNDGFLPIFYIIQSTFRPLQMHSKRCYKICICSVILGEVKSF